MIGKVLGSRYQVIRVLGAGNFGQTFLAEDIHRPGRAKCVVKYLRPARTDASFLPLARSLFQREAQTLERLGSHDQIPRLLAYFDEDAEFYLVQDFIEGHVLRTELPPGCSWSEADVIDLLRDGLKILQFVHKCGVIHRDIKPDNLIRRQNDHKLVLIDFGAVKQMRVSIAGGTLTGDTAVNTIAIGTPGYMPPEQAQGRPRPCSDLYALGMIGIQALSGENPLQLPQDAYGCWNWRTQGKVSDRLVQILNRLVHPSVFERYATAEEALGALDQVETSPPLWQRLGKFLRTPVQDLWGNTDITLSPATVSPEPEKTIPDIRAMADIPETAEELPTSQSRGSTLGRYVFISHSSEGSDRQIAEAFFDALTEAGHHPFMASESIRMGEGWAQRIDRELKQCDFFLLLLSQDAAQSEMVLEEVRTVRALQSQRPDHRPFILPVRVNFPLDLPLNYELRGYLHRLQQRFWRSPADTAALVNEVLDMVNATHSPALASTDNPNFPTTGGVSGQASGTMSVDAPPVPVAEPELPEGQVEVASAFYIERPPIENRCRETLLQPGSLIRIKAPRQMGKTSLMARLLYRGHQEDYATVPLSFQLADAQVFTDLEKLLRWFCAGVGRRLGLENRLKDYWDDIFGSKYNCTAYFEEYLLPNCKSASGDRPLVLGLDEVDRVFEYPEIASDFFGLLRAWHEEAKNRDLWRNLRLIVVHGTEVYIPLDINQSPFNVGLAIDLPEFNAEQICELSRLHSLDLSQDQLRELQALIGGHPYLVRLTLYHLARQDMTWADLFRDAATETGLFRDHLRGQWWHLHQRQELVPAFAEVVKTPESISLDATLGFKLHSLGLVTLNGNLAQVRCDLYRRYFRERFEQSGTLP
ncbi:AAA-like domain-containing protein [Candidatus Synechococcus calcipolaris G9]|uniref:non-specific serine/threonine protein kinase n=1 Tax=Candidatus Synechococcus calcipolaris G9 TaxID=1497997 RepID=A0ABT6F1B8_9SYNE|nr:AAA-like domain-containing protein [Candidatus Synechococcus calcipolaris]MDG2991622.1 AAA-like domain-containing protein [Candidatus Synechococcus calcipolaris G9]